MRTYQKTDYTVVETLLAEDDTALNLTGALAIEYELVGRFAPDTTIVSKSDGPGVSATDENNRSRLAILADANAVASPVPEPATYALLLAGLGVVALSRRRRNAH